MKKSNTGFSLTEIVVVIAILGVGIGLFYSLFINNWSAYEDRIRRANLLSDANHFIEELSLEVRNARTLDVATTSNEKRVTLTNAVDNTVVSVFSISDTGQLSRLKNAQTKIFSTQADFAASSFRKVDEKSVIMNIVLKENVFNRDIHISASSEVFLRN